LGGGMGRREGPVLSAIRAKMGWLQRFQPARWMNKSLTEIHVIQRQT